MRSERSTESRKPPLPPVVTWKHIFVNSHIWALEIAIGAEEENPYLMCQDPARKTEISCAFKSAEPSFWKMATPVIEERRNQTRASEVVSSSHYLQPLTRLEGAGATEETLGLLGSSPRPEGGGSLWPPLSPHLPGTQSLGDLHALPPKVHRWAASRGGVAVKANRPRIGTQMTNPFYS